MDFKLDPDAKLKQATKPGWTVFAYVLSGKAHFGMLCDILVSLLIIYIQNVLLLHNVVWLKLNCLVIGLEDNRKEGLAHQTLVFSDGEHVEVHNKENKVCHFILIGGQPLNEPIVQYGMWFLLAHLA